MWKVWCKTLLQILNLDNGTDGPEHVGYRNSWVISTSGHAFIFNLTIEGLIHSLYLV